MPKDDSNSGRKKRRTRRRLVLGGILALAAGAAAWGVVRLATWSWTPRKSPAGSAPKALEWEGDGSEEARPTVQYEDEPGPQIKFDNLPEVPEKLLKRSPPIEDDTRRSRGRECRSMV